jgi:AcrR family transcriptional regulator
MEQVVKSRRGKISKADATKERIVKVARGLAYKIGTRNLTLRGLAAAAGIEAGSIYYHFDSKDAIIVAVLADAIDGATAAVLQAIEKTGPHSSSIDKLEAAMRAHLKYVVREGFASRLSAIRRLPARLRDHHMKQERTYAAIFGSLLSQAAAEGYIRASVDLTAIRMLSMGALTWVAEWFDAKGPLSLDDLVDQFMHLMRNGLLIEPAVAKKR